VAVNSSDVPGPLAQVVPAGIGDDVIFEGPDDPGRRGVAGYRGQQPGEWGRPVRITAQVGRQHRLQVMMRRISVPRRAGTVWSGSGGLLKAGTVNGKTA
jgi:hypothetical protein